MGLFRGENIRGIVVSPACDVSNFKTETITYLPIIPVRSYFSTIGYLPLARREITERLRSAAFDAEIIWPEPGYLPPRLEELDRALLLIERRLGRPKVSKQEAEHLPRAAAGIRITRACADFRLEEAPLADIATLYGSKWLDFRKQIISNSFRPDLHFLPRDRDDDIGGSPFLPHSLVLFRYPMTIPAEFLWAAQNHHPDQWGTFIQQNAMTSSLVMQFSSVPPLKCLSLKSAFLADLLGRFTTLFSRVGSPDFSSAALERISGELHND
ncbi:hypothetical protein A6U92_05595 [Agrobacterium rubi]|nr:hypothetical protein A6U92_05595 [Agrobacterium rubi]